MTVPSKRATFYGSTSYQAGSVNSIELGAYRPVTRSPDAALLENRDLVDARVRDMERNSGLVTAAIDRKMDSAIGARIRPQIKPNWRRLGITVEQARELGREIEAAWDTYANDPDKMLDAGRRMTFGAMARVQYWHWLLDGRAATVPLWLPRYGAEYGTAFMCIDPLRISNPNGQPDQRYLRGGVEIDRNGAAVAYHVREQNPGDLLIGGEQSFVWTRIPAYNRFGRRRFIFGFSQRHAEQSQGRSPLLAALKKLRMFEKRDDLELQAAANAATFAMTITSEVPSEALFQMMSQAPTGDEQTAAAMAADYMGFAADYYKKNNYFIDGAAVQHLLPNEKLEMSEASRADADFTASQRQWMTYFGWSLGLTYEQVSGDFSKSAYVGIKAGFEVARQTTLADRIMFGDAMLTPQLDLWMQEAVASGAVKLPRGAPDYTMARAAYLAGTEWIGPGPVSIDPAKEASAAKTNMMIGRTTLEQQLAEDGIDAEDQIVQLGQEEAWREKANIPSLWAAPTTEMDAATVAATAPQASDYEPKGQA